MKVYQSALFARKVKKFTLNEKAGLDKEIKKIIDGNSAGEEQKGDLKGVFVCTCCLTGSFPMELSL